MKKEFKEAAVLYFKHMIEGDEFEYHKCFWSEFDAFMKEKGYRLVTSRGIDTEDGSLFSYGDADDYNDGSRLWN